MSKHFNYSVMAVLGKNGYKIMTSSRVDLEVPGLTPKRVLLFSHNKQLRGLSILEIQDALQYELEYLPGRIVSARVSTVATSVEHAWFQYHIADPEMIACDIIEEAEVYFEEYPAEVEAATFEELCEQLRTWVVEDFIYFRYRDTLLVDHAAYFVNMLLPLLIIRDLAALGISVAKKHLNAASEQLEYLADLHREQDKRKGVLGYYDA